MPTGFRYAMEMRPGKQEGHTPSVFRFKGSSECLAYLNPVGTQSASPRWLRDNFRPLLTQQYSNTTNLKLRIIRVRIIRLIMIF